MSRSEEITTWKTSSTKGISGLDQEIFLLTIILRYDFINNVHLAFGTIKGSKSHLQISLKLNITKICKDGKYTIMMMHVKSYSCWL